MTLPSVIVASLALVFTVGSFYWLQARKGRLKLYPVTTFGGAASNETFTLRMPIIIYNTGAIPRVVTGIRLRLQGNRTIVFECVSFRKTMEPTPNDSEDYAHPYVVPGRSVVTKYAHFFAEDFARHLNHRPSVFELEVWLDDCTGWKVLGKIEVHAEVMHTSRYSTYSNSSGLWSVDSESDGQKHRERLAQQRARLAGLQDVGAGDP